MNNTLNNGKAPSLSQKGVENLHRELRLAKYKLLAEYIFGPIVLIVGFLEIIFFFHFLAI